MITQVRKGKLDQYKQLHAQVWPAVLETIRRCDVRNYSIYLTQLPDGKHYLFSYFEYDGDDFDADMQKMAADPTTQKWWSLCKPCLVPVTELPPGEVWTPMEEVFHTT